MMRRRPPPLPSGKAEERLKTYVKINKPLALLVKYATNVLRRQESTMSAIEDLYIRPRLFEDVSAYRRLSNETRYEARTLRGFTEACFLRYARPISYKALKFKLLAQLWKDSHFNIDCIQVLFWAFRHHIPWAEFASNAGVLSQYKNATQWTHSLMYVNWTCHIQFAQYF